MKPERAGVRWHPRPAERNGKAEAVVAAAGRRRSGDGGVKMADMALQSAGLRR